MRVTATLPRAVSVLVLASLTATWSGCLGCGGETSSPAGGASAQAAEPGALRLRFPERAAAVLDAGPGFAAVEGGFRPSDAALPASRRGLAVTLPGASDGAVRFELPGGFAAEVREAGPAGAGAPAGSAVAYVREGRTSYWAATGEGYEEWLHLDARETADGGPVASWEVAGAALQQGGAAVSVVDDAGTARLQVTAPEAYTAGGRRVAARLEARGHTLALFVDARGEEVLVDPAWVATGTMTAARVFHTAALLGNGKVLVDSGASSAGYLQTAELWDPATGIWTATPPPMAARAGHVAVVLQSGKVLQLGGNNTGGCVAAAEVYDPVSNTWSAAGTMSVGRCISSAVMLPNGQVLVSGGLTPPSYVSTTSAEIYDPATNAWSATGAMATARYGHGMVVLPNGQVLAAGGSTSSPGIVGLSSAEIYNPATKQWTTTSPMGAGRAMHTLTLLGNGKVLAAGGGSSATSAVATTELYDPTTGLWAPAGAMTTARMTHTASLLPSGQVLVAGGTTNGTSGLAGAELFDPSTNLWTATASLLGVRFDHTAVVVPGVGVLVAGGNQSSTAIESVGTALATAELLRGGNALGTACSSGLDCLSGFCANGVCCNTACNGGACSACSIAAGGTSNGTCTLFSGRPCNDGSACTQTDTCQNGVCVGANPITCPVSDQCHQPSTCNPATGVCSNVPKPNGTPCSDGNACTQGDACVAGVCTSGAPAVCAAVDQCHSPGTCDPASGCSNPAKPDGTACNSGNLCTQNDVCMGGVCMGGTSVICPIADQCHQPSTCNPATGVCSNVPKPNGTPCQNPSSCNSAETCQSGVCGGGIPKTCTPIDACHVAGVCDPSTGLCSNPPAPDGTACDDGNICTQLDQCRSGACVGQDPVTCPGPKDDCHGAGVCNPVNGTCSNPPLPDGTPCPMGACAGGVCSPSASTSTSAATTSSSSGASGTSSSTGSASGGTGGATASSGGGATASSGATSSSSGTGGSFTLPSSGCGCREAGGDDAQRLGSMMTLSGLALVAARLRRRAPRRRS